MVALNIDKDVYKLMKSIELVALQLISTSWFGRIECLFYTYIPTHVQLSVDILTSNGKLLTKGTTNKIRTEMKKQSDKNDDKSFRPITVAIHL